MLKKVLLTTDFSVASEKAIQTAIDLLHHTECEFTLVYCSDEKDTTKSEYYLNKFKEELENGDTSPFHSYQSVFINKKPIEGIAELIQKEEFAVVIGGSTGTGNAEFGGSVAQFIFRNLTTNAFFVPFNAQIKRFSKALFIVEGVREHKAEALFRFKRFIDCLQISAKIVLLAKDSEQENYVRNELFWEINQLFPNTEIEIRCDENPSTETCKAVCENPTDMIVMLASDGLIPDLVRDFTKISIKEQRFTFLRVSSNQVIKHNCLIRENLAA